ncbi:hypothetical protein Hanom_Chr17g01536321 [Helianthus anomalus]
MRVLLWLSLTERTPHESKMTKTPSCVVHLVRFNYKNLTELELITELELKDVTCKSLQTPSTFSIIIEDK